MPLKFVTGATLETKKKKHLCCVDGCGNKAIKRSGRKKNGGVYWRNICYKHSAKQHKETNPARYYYDRLKGNAKRRRKEFTITIEYFRQWCEETGYLDSKGRGAKDMSIDRIDDTKGYVPGNLQLLPVGVNLRKRYVDYWIRQEELFSEISSESMLAEFEKQQEESANKSDDTAPDAPMPF